MINPWDYKHPNLVALKGKRLRVGIGPSNSGETTEYVEGILVRHSLAANEPFLPADIDIYTDKTETRNLFFGNIRSIEIV